MKTQEQLLKEINKTLKQQNEILMAIGATIHGRHSNQTYAADLREWTRIFFGNSEKDDAENRD